MKDTAQRNREIRKFLTEKYGKGISVTGGTGTAYGWVRVKLGGSFSHDEQRAIEKQIEAKFSEDLYTYTCDDGYNTESYCLNISN
jgi:hypothetical protein